MSDLKSLLETGEILPTGEPVGAGGPSKEL
jgi:hypothetical protein